MAEKDFVWRPYRDYLNSRIARFMAKHDIKTWQELIARSTKDIDWFWNAALEDLGVEWFRPYERLYDDSLGMPWTKWFLGGRLNIVHNCLDRHIRDGKGNKTALLFEADDGFSRSITYSGLHYLVRRLARAMSLSGVRKGDRIALCTPISPEAVAVMLAAFKIGAVCMQPAARYAPREIVGCLNQARAKMLFMNDGYLRAGKSYDLSPTYEAVFRESPTVENIVVIERLGSGLALREKCVSWRQFIKRRKYPGNFPHTEALDSEHPSLILYSSGTTSRTKAIIHTHGGALAQIAKEVGYAFDCREDDVFYWFTNIGWMMAPWEIIGALFFGASVVLYEGTHLYPTPHRIFELIDKYGITIFGFTPTAIRGLKGLNEDFSHHNLSTLRILGSTGEPLDPETWRWYFRTFGRERCPIMNISGGTELIGCLLSPLPVMPQKPGSLGGPGLGMDVDIVEREGVDEEGRLVGSNSGDLVCKKPFPSMTRGFLGERERYLRTYFPWGPDIWVHGDRAERDEDGLWYLRGRSDDLIVSGGVKHDPSKIEAALMSFPGHPRVKEAAAIGAEDKLKGHKIVCFIVLESSESIDEDFLSALRRHVGEAYDPMGRPDEIYVLSALPKNIAAKIPRGLIKQVYEGAGTSDSSKIDNPQALEEISKLRTPVS